MINIGRGTVLDAGFEKVSDKAANFICSKIPQNYSSYTHIALKSDPSLTYEQIYRSMQRSIRINRIVSQIAAFSIDVVRMCLPY